MVIWIEKSLGYFLWQFSDETEDIAHIQRAAVHKDMIGSSSNKIRKAFLKLFGNRTAQLQADNSKMITLF